MSKIYITVDEQNLHIIGSPTIAAEGVNENYIQFSFDSTWDGFGKTALFYRKENESVVYKSLINNNGIALVPHEVLAREGKIYIGVSGVKGKVVQTTEVLGYKIVKGRYVTETNPPSPGIYEQMLTNMGDIQASYETEKQERIEGDQTEAQARTAAISSEANTRASADASLSNAISVERARIDKITSLPSGSTSGDAELIDIRVGADGVTYGSAGTAVRTQITDLKSDLRTLLLTDITIIQDKYVDYGNGVAYDYSFGLDATDYIEISEFDASVFFYGLYYNEDNGAGLAFYDASKTFIPNSGVKLYQLPNNIAIPSLARFIRVTVPQTNTNFALSFASDNTNINAFIDETRNRVVTADECTFISKSKNLFDKSAVTLGYYVDPGTGNLLENANFWASDFIEVEPNQAYTIRYKNQGAQYNANKQGIGDFTTGYSDNTSAAPATGTTKSNAKYVRFCGSLAQLDSDQLEKGSSFTSFEEYYRWIDADLIPPISSEESLADIIYKIFSGNGTQIKLVGDSITHGVGGTGFAQDGEFIGTFFGIDYYRNPNGYCWANLFADFMESEFNCTVTNNAVLGTSFNELNNSFSTLVSSSDDIVICMYGTNNRDSLSSMPSWIQSCINKFKALGVSLIVMTPIPASVSDETNHTNHIEEICNTIKQVCYANNVVCVDTNQLMQDFCEYRNVSINTLLADGLHPNDDGYLTLFNAVCKALGITRKVTGATW